jgi:hypothetical protein
MQNTLKHLGHAHSPGSNPMARHHFEDVHDAIQHFFSFYRVDEAQDILRQFYRAWLISDKPTQLNSHDRDHFIFCYEQLCIVIEASFLLQQERINNGAKLHYIISKPDHKRKKTEHPTPRRGPPR